MPPPICPLCGRTWRDGEDRWTRSREVMAGRVAAYVWKHERADGKTCLYRDGGPARGYTDGATGAILYIRTEDEDAPIEARRAE